MVWRLAMAGLIAIGFATAALAARKPKAAPKSKPASVVNLENKRPVSLLTFEILNSEDQGKIVGRLEKPLASGHSAKVPLSGANGCVFEVRWKFEDAGDSGSVDLCNDAHIVLTD